MRLKKLNHKVNVHMLDYRDIKSKYDIIVSIEMIEAVGEKYLDKYFSQKIEQYIIRVLL
jgi:cyclopropane-fatty-acyl-phospholipid synthase